MPEWKPFQELLAEPLRNGLTRPSAVRGAGTKMVNMGEVFEHSFVTDTLPMERVPVDDNERTKFLLSNGDLLFARQSLVAGGAGKCVLFRTVNGEAVTWESHLIRARLDSSVADARFYYYFFTSVYGRRVLWQIVEQVAAAGVRGSDLCRLRVPYLPLDEQRRVADVLSDLDSKAEVNLRLSRKAADACLLAIQTRLRVAGTRDAEIGDLVEVAREPVHLRNDNASTPYLGLDAMPRGSTVLASWGQRSDVAGTTFRFERGDILFGKLRPYFRKAGVALTDGSGSSEVLILRPAKPVYYGAALATVASHEFCEYATARSSGTRMPRAEWSSVSSFPVPLADDEELQDLTDLARLTFGAIRGHVDENLKLRQIKDTLVGEWIGRAAAPQTNTTSGRQQLGRSTVHK